VPSIRFRLDQPTLRGLAERVRAEYGPGARVLSTEESLTGGLGGFFAKRVIDVTVEVPEHAVAPEAHAFDMTARVGLARLLEDAEQQEAGPPSAEPPVSTESTDFARVLDTLRAEVATPRPPAASERPAWAMPARETHAVPLPAAPVDTGASPPGRSFDTGTVLPGAVPVGRVPPPLPTQPGDLIVVAGLGEDALQVATALARGIGRAHVCDGGSVVGHTRRRVEDRRGALAARAYGVQSGQTVVVAYGLGNGNPSDPRVAALRGIGADQVWVAVDVSRKTVDTARWVNAVRAAVDVAALASLAGRFTRDRDSIAELGLPEGWSDRLG
jgi:hypothetical protein